MMKSGLEKRGYNFALKKGTIITGKWNNNLYIVQREIGSGMIGTVYLCDVNGKKVALKLSGQSLSLATEVSVLKSLNKVQDHRLGPYLLDVDDWELPSGERHSFYVMEYISGVKLNTFIKNHGQEWIGVFLIQMLDFLENLHQSGWVFGDLKNDNLLVEQSPPLVRFIDVGGTTKIGRSIKEYTAFYDRGYWKLGTRRAEPSYDLFSLVMVMLSVYYPRHFTKGKNSREVINRKMSLVPSLRLFQPILQKAIIGKYSSALEMKQELMQTVMNRQKRKRGKQKGNANPVFESLFIIIIASFYYVILFFSF